MKIFKFGNEQSDLIQIHMVDSHSIKIMDSEMELIRNLSGRDDFRLVACQVENWNQDLSPRESPPVFGMEGFDCRAEKTIQKLRVRFKQFGGFSQDDNWMIYQHLRIWLS